MVDTLGDTAAIAGSPSYNGRMLRQTHSVAFAGATTARPLGSRTGLRPGTPTTTVTATATTWTCAAFAGLADVETAVEAAAYPFAFDAPASGAITAASASFPRADIIYVQVDDPSEADGSTIPAVTRKYFAGTAGAGAPVPVPPVSRTFVIAIINVPVSGGGAPSVTWVAPYTVAAGGTLPVANSAAYPATPYIGQQIDDASLGGALRWNGSAWKFASGLIPVTPTISGSSTGITVGPNGVMNFTAVASASFTAFNALFDNYLLVWDSSTRSATVDLLLRLRSGGSDFAAANYDWTRGYDAGSSRTVATAVSNGSFILDAGGSANMTSHGSVTLYSPYLNSVSNFVAQSVARTAGPTILTSTIGGQYNLAAVADGFTLSVQSGTLTGTARLYGLTNN